MIGLLQRVTDASVSIDATVIASIDHGLVVLVGIERGDDAQTAERLGEKILGYRVFSDRNGKMNLSVTDTNGGILLVPQFTLAATTAKGRRPSFASAMPPDAARDLFSGLTSYIRSRHEGIETGRFGAHMQVRLTNDGPVTFQLRVEP